MPADPRMLKKIPLFMSMDDEERAALAAIMDEAPFKAGQVIFSAEETGGTFFIVQAGQVELSITDDDGEKLVLEILESGDFFGEMSLLTGEPRSATVRADGDCEVLEISKEVMAEVLRDSPQCLARLSELLARRRLEGDNIVRDAIVPDDQGKKEREYRASFLNRLRTVFEL